MSPNNATHVSSPIILLFFPACLICRNSESDSICVAPKLFLKSMNVGNVPVVSALILCDVVVGGSAMNL